MNKHNLKTFCAKGKRVYNLNGTHGLVSHTVNESIFVNWTILGDRDVILEYDNKGHYIGEEPLEYISYAMFFLKPPERLPKFGNLTLSDLLDITGQDTVYHPIYGKMNVFDRGKKYIEVEFGKSGVLKFDDKGKDYDGFMCLYLSREHYFSIVNP